ncbi:MAG: ATP synthase F1 subunit gamma [Polyangia bacterium]
MATLKDIRRRIGSVSGTQKITRAMKMVAAAKLRKAQERAESFRDYAELTSSILAEVAEGAGDEDHPLLERREQRRALIVVIGSNRGLCGGFNSNLCRRVLDEIEARETPVELAIIGRKPLDFFRHRDAEIRRVFQDVYDRSAHEAALDIAAELAREYRDGELDRIDLAFNEMLSMVSQKPTIDQLLPVSLPEKRESDDEARIGPAGFVFEPRRIELLGRLLPLYTEVQVGRAILESIAAEQAARMTAMDNATNNAEDMIDSLTLQYNRARQAEITTELMDIVGGAEALSD